MATEYIELVSPTEVEIIEVGEVAGPAGADGAPGVAWDVSWRGDWDSGTADYSANSGDTTVPADIVRGSDGGWYRAAADSIPADTDPVGDDGTYWTLILEAGSGSGAPASHETQHHWDGSDPLSPADVGVFVQQAQPSPAAGLLWAQTGPDSVTVNASRWTRLYVPGRWYDSSRSTTARSGVAYSADTLYLVPFTCVGGAADPSTGAVEQAFDRVGLEVTSAGTASTSARLLLYLTDGSGAPSTLHTDFGLVPIDATGQQTVNISGALEEERLYYLGVVFESACSVLALPEVACDFGYGFGSGSDTQPALVQTVAHTFSDPAPDPAGTMVFGTTRSPSIRLRAA